MKLLSDAVCTLYRFKLIWTELCIKIYPYVVLVNVHYISG